jgi:hypothetical protein
MYPVPGMQSARRFAFSAIPAALASAVFCLLLALPTAAAPQDSPDAGPVAALNAVLVSSCRQDEVAFAHYLTQDNADAFHKLTPSQRTSFLQRFSLQSEKGHPIISTADKNHTVLRCEAPGASSEFRFGEPSLHDNLAFIPVDVPGRGVTRFGFIRQSGNWCLLSLGLLLIDIPELIQQWAEQDLEDREDTVAKTLQALALAIRTYRRAYGNLPESLAQMGPPPASGASPDAADLVDEDLAAGHRDGYQYRYRILPAPDGALPGFELAATPETYRESGKRSFFLDALGDLHAADHRGTVALAEDPVIASVPPEEKSGTRSEPAPSLPEKPGPTHQQ